MPDSLKEPRETILVVDDNPSILQVVAVILRQANFRVLSADSGPGALKLMEETDEKIDLLLSDVHMPEMSGPDLGQELKKTRTDLHVILMSGKANGNLLVLNYGWSFIEKPFVPMKLVEIINEVLHSPDRSQRGDEFNSRKDTSVAKPE